MNELAPTREDDAQPISAEDAGVDLRAQAGKIDVAAHMRALMHANAFGS